MGYVKILPVTKSTHLSSLLDYISKDSKTLDGQLIDCHGCSRETVYSDFFDIKKQYGKTDKILAHQCILSFKREDVSPAEAHEVAGELAHRSFPGYQYTVATHVDAENVINSHIVLNSVNADFGYKYHSNKTTLESVRRIGDEICLERGLPIITERSDKKSIDKKTYDLAMRGKSWKVALASDLDGIIGHCQSKEEFTAVLSELGYSVNYADKNITVTKNGEKKGVRLDTLAKQFGDKYKKQNIEKYFKDVEPQKEPTEHTEPEELPKRREIDQNYSEWSRYERAFAKRRTPPQRINSLNIAGMSLKRLGGGLIYKYIPAAYVIRLLLLCLGFAARQISRPPKVRYSMIDRYPAVERRIGNVSMERLISAGGRNTSVLLRADQVLEIEKTGLFYSGTIRPDGNIRITFKSINDGVIANALGQESINKIPHNDRELLLHARQNELVRTELARNGGVHGGELVSFTVTRQEIAELDRQSFPFRYYTKPTKTVPNQPGRIYSAVFCHADLNEFCTVTGRDYLGLEMQAQKNINSRMYAKLKQETALVGDKLCFRVVDRAGLELLQKSNLKFCVFQKDGKYNTAFPHSQLSEYESVIKSAIPKARTDVLEKLIR